MQLTVSGDTYKEDIESRIELLRKQIDGLEVPVETIQFLSISPTDPTKLQWIILSRDTKRHISAVDDFAGVRRDDNNLIVSTERSLAYDQCKSFFLYSNWSSDSEEIQVPRKFEFGVFDHSEFERPPISDGVQSAEITSKFELWTNAIERNCNFSGGNFWLSTTHRIPGLEDNAVSSIYCVIHKALDKKNDSEKIDKIAKLLNEYLNSYILSVFQYQIERKIIVMRESMNNFLKAGENSIVLSKKVSNKISISHPIIISGLPLIIEGAAGTGKLTAALFAASGLPDIDIKNSSDVQILNCDNFLNFEEFRSALLEVNLLDGVKPVLIKKVNLVIFKNYHLAEIGIQKYIVTLVENKIQQLSNSEKEIGPYIIVTTSLISSSLKGKTDNNLLNLKEQVGGFSIQLPTLVDRLNELNDVDSMNEFREIVDSYFVRAVQIFPSITVNRIDDDLLKIWRRQLWERNYDGLRNEILKHVISSADTDR